MSTDTIAANLERARRDLLELTTRSRLLDAPRGRKRNRTIEVEDELGDEAFRILVKEKRTMFFDHREDAEDDTAVDGDDDQVTFAVDEEAEVDGLAARYTDNRLQTDLTKVELQKRLLAMYYDARTYEEEHGVGVLYLAVGFLRWFEDDNSDRPRHAPLMLIPVRLERQSARQRFSLSFTDDEISTNLSLQAKLKADFGLKLPDIGDADDLIPSTYASAVTEAVSSMSRWEVLLNDIQLGFFSFTKFLMYRDLDNANWPDRAKLTDHRLIGGLLGGGLEAAAPIVSDGEKIETLIDPADTRHVLDADSSQAVAIEEVRRGRDLVIQGPPGTGKSQTIANLIAAAVADKKKVLFVAEKMAALEVVKRRLENLQLGEMCLELHSHKARKRAVLDELERTLNAGRPSLDGVAPDLRELVKARDALNAHAERMHRPLKPSQIAPYRLLGEYARLTASGAAAPAFTLDRPTEWTPSDFEERRALLRELLSCLDAIRSPANCPWRGVGLNATLPTDLTRINNLARVARDRLLAVRERAGSLAQMVNEAPPERISEAARLATECLEAGEAPDMEFHRLTTAAWRQRRSEIQALVEAGVLLSQLRNELRDVTEAGWGTDVAETRTMLAAHARSWFRIFNRDYRRANAVVRGLLTCPPPKTAVERIAFLDRLIAGQKAQRTIREQAALGRDAFGACFHGTESDWNHLRSVVDWESRQSERKTFDLLVKALTAGEDRQTVAAIGAELKGLFENAWTAIESLVAALELSLEEAFGASRLRDLEFDTLLERFDQWATAADTPAHWISYRIRREQALQLGLGELVSHLSDGRLARDMAVDQFDLAYYDALLRWHLAKTPELARFRGQSHEEIVARFRELDRARITLARHEVALAHYESTPRCASDVGAVGCVRKEIAKKRNLRPLRQLMRVAGRAVQAIKPVFMMSPLSVAQFLEPGAVEFDLLLIDEASQVRPVDALGAIARARQVVVVGDDKQLPPTTFFARMLEEDDNDDVDESETFAAGDIESILGLCRAQNMPSRMLSWHYRSQHHSLIAVSNREYYDNRLYVIPSPCSEDDHLGLRFHHVADGVFDRGGRASNRNEAERVAAAIIQHAQERPELSLGVGAFSIRQRDEIRFAVERMRRNHPETEQFFSADAQEPFFVKNLETVQGDERDVVFISVGYGRDKSGAFLMNFGPLGAQGGERRLNVLITRARRRCEVFSSITDEDIDLSRANGAGPRGLKAFLQYARTGNLDIGSPSARKRFESPFEEAVANDLVRQGFRVEPQVGVAGFFIDIGVRDPDVPGRFLLGIECDGAQYHSARWARDRDRLRQTILEARGWTIHRIWSADWLHDREGQLRRVLEAIERAKARIRETPTTGPTSEPSLRIVRAAAEQPNDREPTASVPYKEAAFRIRLDGDLHETPTDTLILYLNQIVSTEGPIHGDEAARRLTALAGKKRTGARIAAAIQQALEEAVRAGVLYEEDGFYTSEPNMKPPIRNRANASASVRKCECLPPSELRAAITACVDRHVQISRDEAVRWVARVLGFAATGEQLAAIVAAQIQVLARRGQIQIRDGVLLTPVSRKEHDIG